jgi:hypothetical protein
MSEKSVYGEHYPYHKAVPIIVKHDKNGKTLYYQAIDRAFIKRIGQTVVDSLKAEGRAIIDMGVA